MSDEKKYKVEWTTKGGEHKEREYTLTQLKQLFCKANHLIMRHLWQYARGRTSPKIYEGMTSGFPDGVKRVITIDRYNRTLNYGVQHYTSDELIDLYGTTGIPKAYFIGEQCFIRDNDFLELCYNLFKLRSARIDTGKSDEERKEISRQYAELETNFNKQVSSLYDKSIQKIINTSVLDTAFDSYCYFLKYSKKKEWQNSKEYVIDGIVQYISDIKFDDVDQCSDIKRCTRLAKVLQEKLDMVETVIKYKELNARNLKQKQKQQQKQQ